MRFGHIELFVGDSARSRAFYVDGLGFELAEEQPGGFVWMILDGVEVLLRPGRTAEVPGSTYASGACGIVLYVDDLESTKTRLATRGIHPAGEDGPGCPVFRDPDGHWIQIIENEE